MNDLKPCRIGLIDVDGHNFPNLPLMKISAWHKAQGDHVEWYNPLSSGHMNKVYMSKVFSFSRDYEYFVDADEVVKGGSGYCISLVDGKEVFDKSKDIELPYEIEHICPDYSLYGIANTAYGFLSRGCPRGCHFCHVEAKESNATTVMLIPARTDTGWFHDYIYGKAEIRFVRGRLKFSGHKYNAPFPCMIVVFRRAHE